MELRERIANILEEAEMGCATARRVAGEILEIPEIAEALRICRGEIDGIVTTREMTREEIERTFNR